LVALALPATRSPSRYFIAVALGVVAGILPLLVFNQLAYGSAVEQGYGVKPFDTPILEGLYGLLLSPSRGLFIYEPWAFLALASFGIARFANTTRGRISERIAGLLIPWAVLLGAYATYAEWWGGRVFGPRFLDDFAPLLIAGLAWGVRGGWFAVGRQLDDIKIAIGSSVLRRARDAGFAPRIAVTTDNAASHSFAEAGAEVAPPTTEPFHLGKEVHALAQSRRLERICTVGAGAGALFTAADLEKLRTELETSEALVLSNNYYSADLVAFTPASALGVID